MFADYAAINSRKQFDYGLFSKSFIFYQASANGSACLALKSFNRLVEGSDDGLSAGLAFNELDGSFNLGQHGAGCEMPFRHIAASLFNGHGCEGFLFGFAEIDANLFNSGQDDECIGIDVLCEAF